MLACVSVAVSIGWLKVTVRLVLLTTFTDAITGSWMGLMMIGRTSGDAGGTLGLVMPSAATATDSAPRFGNDETTGFEKTRLPILLVTMPPASMESVSRMLAPAFPV